MLTLQPEGITVGNPWLSVVMPVLNGANFLEQALQSLASQADSEIEVIVVDGGSTDGTAEILNSFANRLPLRMFACGHLKGWVSTTNFGLTQARGDYACFLHQDDLWMDGRTRVLRQLVRRHPEATMLLHPSWFIDESGTRIGLWRCPLPEGLLDPALIVERLLIQNFIATPAPLFSRIAAVRLGGLEEGLWYTADWDFWLKLAAEGPAFYHPRPLAAFRIHPHAQTMQGSSQVDDFHRQLEIVLTRHLGDRKQARRTDRQLGRVARFSIDVNTSLAALVHGRESQLGSLFWRFVRLGPSGWRCYFRDSRIIERTLSRYRVGLASRRTPSRPRLA